MSALDLISELRRGSFDYALLATYEFDLAFFERYCLRRLEAFANAGKVVVFGDRSKYAELLSAPEGHRPRLAGRRYYFNPVSCRGVFHPKVFLFCGPRRGLLIIGSCNLSKAGLSANAELAACFRFERGKNEDFAPLFASVYLWFARLQSTRSVAEAVTAAGVDCLWLREALAPESVDAPRFLDNLERPLWEQLQELVGGEPSSCVALSPFFDREPGILDEFADLDEIELYSDRGRTTMTSAWLEHPSVLSGRARLTLSEYGDKEGRQRLHAKAIALRSEARTVLAFGSANFTTPALLRTPARGNCECMLVLPRLPADFDLRPLFDPLRKGQPATLEDLGNADEEPVRSAPSSELCLLEARLDDDGELSVELGSPVSGDDDLWIVLALEAHRPARLRARKRQGRWAAAASEAVVRRCASAVALVHVEAEGEEGVQVSDPVFLYNLEQLGAGASSRARVRVQAALESAEDFRAVLDSLLEERHDAQLLRFFQLCNISISGRRRLGKGPRARPPGVLPGAKGLRGRAALDLARSVDAAALDFIDRHRRRLARHAADPTLAGIPSFMQVVRAILDVSGAQFDTLVAGLGSGSSLSTERWKWCRNFAEAYLVRVAKVLELIGDGYLVALEDRYLPDETGPELRPDLDPLIERCETMLALRERLDEAQPKIRREFEESIRAAGYFAHDLLHEQNWGPWRTGVQGSLRRFEAWTRG